MREPARETRPVGHEQRDVVEARVPVGRLRARLLDEADELGVACRVTPEPLVAREHAQPDDSLPVVERAVEVGDRQLDGAHVRAGRDLHTLDDSASSSRVLELRLLRCASRERERAAAHLRVQLVLDLVDLRRARIRLGPEVARVGRVAAELEAIR